MVIEDFLAQLNEAEKGWGLWLDRDNGQDYHIGQYAFESDCMPKSYLHVDNLDNLVHSRQKYISSKSLQKSQEASLAKEWVDHFLTQWRSQNCRSLV